MRTLTLCVIGLLGVSALTGCDRHQPKPESTATPDRGDHGGESDPHREHKQHPRSIHSTLERATGEAPDHTGSKP